MKEAEYASGIFNGNQVNANYNFFSISVFLFRVGRDSECMSHVIVKETVASQGGCVL